jgi:hypothetical protein
MEEEIRRMSEEEIRERLKEAFRRLDDKVDVPPWIVADGLFALGYNTLEHIDTAERLARECNGWFTTGLWYASRDRALLEDAVYRAEREGKISSEESESLQQLLDRFFEIKEDKIRENLREKCRCKLFPY